MNTENNNTHFISDDAKFTNPPNKLKQKVGSGGIPERLVDQGQGFIEENDIDFLPFANEYLREVKRHLNIIRNTENKEEQITSFDKITQNIMSIKAHGGMFNYPIMSDIADIALSFLEGAETRNEDLYKIIDAHNNSMDLIIAKDIKDSSDSQGSAIIDALYGATLRYQKKYAGKK